MAHLPPWIPGQGRLYYGSSLPSQQPPKQHWSRTTQKPFYSNQWSGMSLVGLGATALGLGATGYIPTRSGRMWDKYVGAIRAIEEYSPGGMLRTFQLSNFFSQFESATQHLTIPGTQLTENEVYARYLENRIGHRQWKVGNTTVPTINRLFSEGVQLRNGRLYWGQGNEVALKYAGAIRSSPRTASWMGKALAVHGGISLPDAQKFFVTKNPWAWKPQLTNPTAGKMAAQIFGSQSRLGIAGMWTQAYGTEWVGRFNRLLQAPVSFPIIENVFSKIQNVVSKLPGKPNLFSVKDGTGGQMMARLVGKYGLLLPTAYMGYQTLDWMAKGSRLTKGTIFEEGITTGLATVAVKAHLAASRVADIIGLHAYREKQEEIAPGSTSLQKLLAFPLMGAMAGGLGLYGIKAAKMAHVQLTHPRIPSWKARMLVEDSMKSFMGRGWMARTARAMVQADGWYSRPDRLGNIWRRLAERVGHENELSFRLLKHVGPAKLVATVGFAAGLAAVLPFLPGALVPGDRPKKLRDIYSGREEVPVRAGRMWEFGRSSFEGDKVSYYRPNWYARMRINAREKGLWGKRAETESPFKRWLKQEFTYNWELSHLADRPYPITALPFQDVPLIGPILANTIGRVIKPPKLMHVKEWRKGQKTLVPASRAGERVATEVGEQIPGKPVTPYRPAGMVGEQFYRMTEMAGLPGFAITSIKEAITGTGDLFDQQTQLETPRRAFGFERKYWEQELGGLFGSSEAFRRLYPHRQRQIPLYNPIRNTMPDWMPGANEKSPDFLTGDPYTKVPEGELRLPGEGYAARFPELAGIAPKDYPLIHRFKILADVAPYSTKYGEALNALRAKRKSGNWSEEEERIFQTTNKQNAARKIKKEFNEYQHLNSMGKFATDSPHWGGIDSTGLLATLNEIHAKQGKQEHSVFARAIGGYWEALSHNAETAIDQLTPMSPGAKLVHQRTAIEDYERTRLYGSSNAFWQHPIRDFIRPTYWSAARSMGFKGIPDHVQRHRDLENYFDTLKYIKYTRLANIARVERDHEASKEFVAKKNQTLFGMNPYTFNFTSIFNALPRTERDYFNAFSSAKTEAERKRVLEMVPENEKALYKARWKLNFVDEVRRAKKAGKLSERQTTEAEGMIANIIADSQTGGLPQDKALRAEYLKTRGDGESYADWYRRTHLLTKMKNIPGPDWVGWHPSVDLNDIKLRVIQTIGEDMHDYDLWQQQAQVLSNKPFVDQTAIEPILSQEKLPPAELHARIDTLLLQNNLKGHTSTRTQSGKRDEVDIEVKVKPDHKWVHKAVH